MPDINTVTGVGLTVGELAVKHNLISSASLEKAMRACAGLENGYDAIPEYLVAQEIISQRDCDRIISLAKAMAARGYDVKFGAIAIQKGFITQSMLELALEEQSSLLKNKKKYALLGNILVDAGMLTPQQRDIILGEQNRYQSANARGASDNGGQSVQNRRDAIDNASFHSRLDLSEQHKNFAQSEIFPSGIRLIIKGDGNAAYMIKTEIFNKDMSIGQIKELLASRNIIHGITENSLIQKFIESDIYLTKPFKIAEGNAPIQSKDAAIQYFFTKNRLKAGTIREDGTIDFRERGIIPQVDKGAILAVKRDAVEGQVGKNIFNDTVRVKPARDIRLKAGKGAVLSPDKLKVIAAVSGHPKLSSDGTIYVYDTFVVQGDVDFKTGNIDYQGDVNVRGCVQNGFKVKANNIRAIEIDGASVVAQGNVIVEQGINESKISSQGSLSAKFIQNSTISCVGDVKTEKEIVESNIECSGICNIRGVIISSKIAAKMGLYAKQVGMEKATPSIIRVGVDSFAVRTLEKIDLEIEEKKETKKRLKEAIANLQQEVGILEDKVLSITFMKEQQEDERMDILSALSAIDSKTEQLKFKKMQSELDRITRISGETNRKLSLLHENIGAMRQTLLDTEKQVKENEELSQSLKKERGILIEWMDKNPGNPIIKVDAHIMAGTQIHGRFAEDTIRSSVKAVVIREDQVSRTGRDISGRDNDPNLWKMYITKI